MVRLLRPGPSDRSRQAPRPAIRPTQVPARPRKPKRPTQSSDPQCQTTIATGPQGRGKAYLPKADDPCTDPGIRYPMPELVEVIGLEPTTPCLQSRCSPS